MLIALLLLSFGCLVAVDVLWLILAVPLVGLRCVIVVILIILLLISCMLTIISITNQVR